MNRFRLLTALAALPLFGLMFPCCKTDVELPKNETVRVTSVELDETLKGGADLLTGQILDISGKFTFTPADATNTTASYNSSDASVATVSGTGQITAVSAGTSTITVMVDTKTNSFTLTVTDPPIEAVRVESVTIDSSIAGGVTLLVNRTLDISDKVTVLPENATYPEKSYNSSDNTVASVSDAGVVTALSDGTATITVTADGKSDSFVVTVETVTSIAFAAEIKAGQTLAVGSTLDLSDKFTIDPADAVVTVEYSSDATGIATVSTAGVVTAAAVGTATITVTAAGKSDSFTLTVVSNIVDVDSVDFAADIKAGQTLAVGSTLDLAGKVTILPDNATDKTMEFASTVGTVATVSAEGVVTAVGPGTTTISVTAGGKTDTFELTVTRVVSLSISGITVPIGATNRIWDKVNVLPAVTDLKTKNITFASSNEAAATVDEYGVVIGVAAGNATITVAATENADVKATLAVTVVPVTYYDRNTTDGLQADQVWTMSTANNLANNQTLTGAFDGVWGSTNSDANANIFGLSRSGINASNPMEFTVDMKTSQVVNAFKIIHRSGPNTNRLVRFFGFDEISGSNDGTNFTTIATNVEVPDAQSPVLLSISEAVFENTVAYQYIRFTCKTPGFCFIHGMTGYPGISLLLNSDRSPNTSINGGNIQNHNDNQGGSNQIQELYLGKVQ